MSMNFLSGMQIRQFKKILVKGFRLFATTFLQNRPPGGWVMVKPGDGEAWGLAGGRPPAGQRPGGRPPAGKKVKQPRTRSTPHGF